MGYVAARECRKVQVERPRASTSGGQSGLGVEEEGEPDAAFAIDLGIGMEDDAEGAVSWDWVWDCD